MKNKRPPILFLATYLALGLLTLIAIAIPPGIMIHLWPASETGAVIMVIAVAALMVALVVEIWRHTAKEAGVIPTRSSRNSGDTD